MNEPANKVSGQPRTGSSENRIKCTSELLHDVCAGGGGTSLNAKHVPKDNKNVYVFIIIPLRDMK